jgi:FkbM family methyltransferase
MKYRLFIKYHKIYFIAVLFIFKLLFCMIWFKNLSIKFQNAYSLYNLKEINQSLKIYDLNRSARFKFDCIKTGKIEQIDTTICLHNLDEDAYVSASIKQKGVWESDLVKLFMKLLISITELQVLDIGAQLGQYSLFAAKLNRTCIAVEPFYDSYIRLHEAAIIENVTDNIILVTNGVSDKRGEIKRLSKSETNIGGQKVIDDRIDYSEIDLIENKYLLKTILLDDLVTVMPRHFRDAIIKIDIENYEVKAFKKASILFDHVNIHVVFMEWNEGGGVKQSLSDGEVNFLLDFFYQRKFVCFDRKFKKLDGNKWKIWPGFVIWINSKSQFDFQYLLNIKFK